MTEAVRRATGEELEIVGASRTDGGAHARGQVVHFDTENPMPGDKWAYILNRVLPEDCRAVASQDVEDAFHARFSATSRTYEYRILIGEGDPFRGRYAHIYWKPLDIEAMREAAKALVGEHDFRGYTEEVGPEVENTVRILNSIRLESPDEQVSLTINGTAFLRGMMRRIAGMLFEIGRDHRPIADAKRLLTKERDAMQWPVVLPARGLTLMEVRYDVPGHDSRRKDDDSDE